MVGLIGFMIVIVMVSMRRHKELQAETARYLADSFEQYERAQANGN